jgi:myo-inositol 2-dehydrogenase / D-chiro-inositol 1-dehydrogenase
VAPGRKEGGVRLAFAGCGRVTAALHLPALRRVPEIEVVALCDPDGDRLTQTGKRFGITMLHRDLDSLLLQSPIDAIAVCVSPAHHAEVACRVMAAGKHLFVEKPLALSEADCDRILEAAAQSSGVRVVGFNLRQHRLVIQARELIQRGALGRIELIRSSFTTDIRQRQRLPQWRDQRHAGGGVLFELATHHFDLWRWLLGREVEEVSARSRDADSEDIVATVSARLAGGILATGQFAESTYPVNELEVLGGTGRLKLSLYDFDGLQFVPLTVTPGSLSARVKRLGQTVLSLPAGLRSAVSGGAYLETFVEEWRRFAASVRDRVDPAASLEDGRAAALVSIAAARSASSGEPVSLLSFPS